MAGGRRLRGEEMEKVRASWQPGRYPGVPYDPDRPFNVVAESSAPVVAPPRRVPEDLRGFQDAYATGWIDALKWVVSDLERVGHSPTASAVRDDYKSSIEGLEELLSFLRGGDAPT